MPRKQMPGLHHWRRQKTCYAESSTRSRRAASCATRSTAAFSQPTTCAAPSRRTPLLVLAVAKPHRLRLTEGRTDFTIAVDEKLGGVAHDTS